MSEVVRDHQILMSFRSTDKEAQNVKQLLEIVLSACLEQTAAPASTEETNSDA